jgi:osmotically-inducible protein OsmY
MSMPDDATLQTMVLEELEREPSVNAAHIGVTVNDGVVTLSGFVETYAAKAAAERAASRVRGVKALAEEIEVRLPNAQKHADDEIAEQVLRILAWDTEVPHERLHVKVEHGIVTLTGEVTHQFQRAVVESTIRRLAGVRGVANLLCVLPVTTQVTDPNVVRQKIEHALRRNAEIEASHIDITVDGGTVTLRGHVMSWSERSVAENAAWAAPGVSEVKDELEVKSWRTPL